MAFSQVVETDLSFEVRTNPLVNGLTRQAAPGAPSSGARIPFEFVNATTLKDISGPEAKKLVRSHARRVRQPRSGATVHFSRPQNRQPKHSREDCYGQTAVSTMTIGMGSLIHLDHMQLQCSPICTSSFFIVSDHRAVEVLP